MAVTRRGHTVHTEVRDRRAEFGDRAGTLKYWAVCSCGYRSKWWGTEDSATVAALTHLWRETAPTMTKAEFAAELRASA